MLRYEDCLAFSGFDEAEVHSISRRLRIPQVLACAVGASRIAGSSFSGSCGGLPETADVGATTGSEFAPAIQITRNDLRQLWALLERLGPRGRSTPAAFLERELSRAQVVEPEAIETNVVTMGSRVLFERYESGRIRTGTLIYPDAPNRPINAMSILSTPAIALLGLSEGASMHWRFGRGRGWGSVAVLRVMYQPEACGQFA